MNGGFSTFFIRYLAESAVRHIRSSKLFDRINEAENPGTLWGFTTYLIVLKLKAYEAWVC